MVEGINSTLSDESKHQCYANTSIQFDEGNILSWFEDNFSNLNSLGGFRIVQPLDIFIMYYGMQNSKAASVMVNNMHNFFINAR